MPKEPTQPERYKAPKGLVIESLGQKCDVVNPDIICGSTDFDSLTLLDLDLGEHTVSNVKLTAVRVNINGEDNYVLQGRISLDHDLVDTEEDLISILTEAIVSTEEQEKDGFISVKPSAIPGVFHFTGQELNTFIAEVDQENREIIFGNFRFSNDGNRFELANPLASDKLSREQCLGEFLNFFMHLMESTYSLVEDEEQAPELPKTYKIEGVVDPDFDIRSIASSIGMIAIGQEDFEYDEPVIEYLLADGKRIKITDPEVKFSDLGGMRREKEEIREIVDLFLNPDVVSKWDTNLAPGGLLLYGEPGVGKSAIAEAVASEIGARYVIIKSSDIYDKWQGGSEKNMQSIMDAIKAYTAGKLVVVIEEIDAVIDGRTSHSPNRNAAGIFKDEIARLNNPNVFIIATTNHDESVDQTLIRSGRFDDKIYVEKPDDIDRKDIFKNIINGYLPHDKDGFVPFDLIDYDQLVQVSDGLTPSDIVTIFKKVFRRKMREEIKGLEPGLITTEDIINQIKA